MARPVAGPSRAISLSGLDGTAGRIQLAGAESSKQEGQKKNIKVKPLRSLS